VHQLSAGTPEGQFAQLFATDPSRPFVTYYDEATGERSELSVKSLANWVAKTHHLLGDELGLGVGDTAVIALPAHWISVPIVLGCLTAGLELTAAGAGEVAFVTPATVTAAGNAPDVYAVAPAAAAIGFRDAPPAATLDYVTAVRPQADAWGSVQMPARPSDPALAGLSRAELVEQARSVGLAAGARVLTTRSWTTADDWIETVLAPLAVAGSLVIVANCGDAEVLERRITQERATVRI
jgi:uncharacterized protein (TIGR03089 family)